ncbi:MASE1 domain-containing protein [Hyalangium gracile]|uniref:MASE1 domain-containing protein n=1 Tax=Hyalangium gracile TaxID=394092 RepID=UPI001CCF458C|nr:MASE1 domain-containing protein [Hyalangium gracile]
MVQDALILPRWHPGARLALFASLYLGLASLGRELTTSSEQSSAVWLPSGLVLFALLMSPARHWPAVALTTVALGFLTQHSDRSGVLTLLVSTCGALEALVGAALLRRLVGPRVELHRVRDVLGLVTLSAGLSTLATAFVAVSLIVLSGASSWQLYWPTWWVFWLGDAMGVLVLAPLLLAWTHGLKGWEHRRRWELGATLLVVGTATHVVFRSQALEPWWALHPLVYLSLPFILWAALRLEAAGTTAVTALISTVALWHTAQGHGPFSRPALQHLPRVARAPGPQHHEQELSAPSPAPGPSQRLALLQLFLGAVNISGLLLAAALGERRRAQLEVSALNQELRHSLEVLARTQSELLARERMAALGELSATLAHEVRNPLGAIANCVSALRHLPGRRPEPQEEALLDIIDEEVQRLDQLVRELLDFARPVRPRPRPQPLEAVVEGALCAALRSQGPNPRITVLREVEPALPPALVDAPLLHLAFTNLFTNALQAMPDGGALQVRIARDERAPQQLQLSISDTGRGMSPEVQRRIFEPFFTTRANGIGLGLPIVLRIVEGHLGQVEVRSTEGRGTTFTVRLPCTESATEQPLAS